MGFQLTAYSGRDDKLFRGAIMQSGNPVHFNRLNDPLDYADQYNLIVSRTPCVNATSQLECLRGLSAEQYNASVNVTSVNATADFIDTTNYMPVLDGDFI